jgi:hypothetical protein
MLEFRVGLLAIGWLGKNKSMMAYLASGFAVSMAGLGFLLV